MSEIESNDSAQPIERTVKGKLSGRASMVVPPNIRLATVEENQAAASLKAWQEGQRERELEKELERLDAELAAFKK
jgi:hypothetical protein